MKSLIYAVHKVLMKGLSLQGAIIPAECIIGEEETIEHLLSTGKSLIRWGDGETSILLGRSLAFQSNSLSLMQYYRMIVKSYGVDSRYMLALPTKYLRMTGHKLQETGKRHQWHPTRYACNLFFPKGKVKYADAFIFREETSLANSEIEKLWVNSKHVILMHNNYKYFIDFAAKYPGIDCHFIPVLPCGAYGRAGEYMQNAFKSAKAFGLAETRVLVSAGPAGKPIVFWLSQRGLISYDMGHYFDYKFYGLVREWKRKTVK